MVKKNSVLFDQKKEKAGGKEKEGRESEQRRNGEVG